MTDLDLFGTGGPDAGSDGVDPNAPLAARMRPRTLDDFQGQEQLLGQGKAIRAMLETHEDPASAAEALTGWRSFLRPYWIRYCKATRE